MQTTAMSIPSEQYWLECEKRLRYEVTTLPQPPSFISTLYSVKRFLECITIECGDSVRRISVSDQNVMALCITSKLIFNTAIVFNLDIPHFLRQSYCVGPRVQIK